MLEDRFPIIDTYKPAQIHLDQQNFNTFEYLSHSLYIEFSDYNLFKRQHNGDFTHNLIEVFFKISTVYIIIRSRKHFSTTYPIVSFFSPDLLMKISNFSKTVHAIFIKFLQSFSTPWYGLCVQFQ